MSTIGMMEGAFFVGRKEIMDWVNQTLDLNLPKVEDTANGAVACQLLDIMYPGKVPMSKVNWAAKQSFEFVGNYKVLQTCFTKLNIDRRIDVDRLITGKYMDNLEFMQWFKRFFEMALADKGDYDSYAQRSKGKGGAAFAAAGKRPTSAVSRAPARAPAPPALSSAPKVRAAPVKAKVSGTGANGAKSSVGDQENVRGNMGNLPDDKEIAAARAAAAESARAHAELRVEMEGLEKERDFYFEKLRDIEIMLQVRLVCG
ncbi:calponin homology domain-containing protein [Ochromonadaceae sp. CCMP2298]|jgi:RP/EB family microtubule-associated protein|nr:calponin homology domain-containing protein [Ochromonadaceae sp. CCMP2298]